MLNCIIYRPKDLKNKMNESTEKIKSGKEILKGLESEGLYIFHGSMNGNIEILEPRQSKHADLRVSTEMINDGEPAVSATPYSEIAIFRSIMRGSNLGVNDLTTKFEIVDGNVGFHVSTMEAIEKAKDKNGYVYVFNKSDFQPYDRNGNVNEKNMEWRSYKPVKPIQVIEVNFGDLPDMEKIKVVDR